MGKSVFLDEESKARKMKDSSLDLVCWLSPHSPVSVERPFVSRTVLGIRRCANTDGFQAQLAYGLAAETDIIQIITPKGVKLPHEGSEG